METYLEAVVGIAQVPSGANTSTYEAVELRDNDEKGLMERSFRSSRYYQ